MHQDSPARWTIPQAELGTLVPGDPRVIGPFRIRGRIGSGGMATVYLGTGRRGQQVAVKLIRGDQVHDGEFRARFRREVRAAADVRSRFFANLVDADPEAELPWLATEYIPGPTLSRAVAVQGPLPRDAVLTLVAGVAEALHAIHAAGLVHRDVKPSNVILGPGGPCLIDLGVVAVNDATRVTMTGQPVGTPLYMAPEQAAAGRTTSAADVWALGALAYRAATGNALFTGDHPAVVLYRVAAEEPSYDDCPEYLRPFLDACLVRDPERRPSMEAILHVSGLREMADVAAGGRGGEGWSATPGGNVVQGGSAKSGGNAAAGEDAAPGRGAAPGGRDALGGSTAPGGDAAAGSNATSGGNAAPDGSTSPSAGVGSTQPGGRRSRGHSAVLGGSPLPPRRRVSRVLVAAGVVAGVVVLAGALFGVLQSLDIGAGGPGAAQPTSDQSAGATPEPTEEASRPAPPPDGSDDNPWAQGTTKRLGKASCWNASVDGVQGRVATLTIQCDKAGTPDYAVQTPSEWLAVYAVAADGTTRPSIPEDASATDTFWTQGDITDPASVTLTVTLPDLEKPTAAVAVRHTYGYGWAWAATP